MKLRTSFCNGTVLKKNITRFAPLWGVYTVLMAVYLVLDWNSAGNAARFMNDSDYLFSMMGTINLIYAGICGMLLFSDLYTPRMCNMLHAMPLRRETWFGTNLITGLLFCLVPNLLGTCVAAALLGRYAYGAFLWLGAVLMQFLLFFGMAVFSALCAGTKLGMSILYLILNFISLVVESLAANLYEPVMYGMMFGETSFQWLRPVAVFGSGEYIVTEYDKMLNLTRVVSMDGGVWIYTAVAAVVGLLLMVAALFIYRKRPLETAGDLISLKPAIPLAIILYTLCVGTLFFGMAGAEPDGQGLLFLLLGIAVGYFTGRMLQERKVHVFRGRNWRNLGIFIGVLFASLLLAWLDPLGVTRWVPEANKVESVMVSSDYFYLKYPQSYEYSGSRTVQLNATEDVEAVIGIHEAALDHYNSLGGQEPVYIRYQMKNGRVVLRKYVVFAEEARVFYELLSRPEAIMGTNNPEALLQKVHAVEIRYDSADYNQLTTDGRVIPYTDKEESIRYVEGTMAEDPVVKGLVDAIYADCLAGNMCQLEPAHEKAPVMSVELYLVDPNTDYHSSIWIAVYPDSENTYRYIQSLACQ